MEFKILFLTIYLRKGSFTVVVNQDSGKKTNFIFSDCILHFVCYLGMVDLHKNARNICFAIYPGFTKNIASLPGLIVAPFRSVS